MKRPSIALAPEGVPYIFMFAFAGIVFALLRWPFLAVLGLAATIFSLHFFRDPERVPPHDEDVAVAPADGKVVKVGQAEDPITREPRTVICIFMNVFDVHVNRAPAAGTVTRIEYIPGAFLNASLDKASEDNERCMLRIEDGERSWTVVQIAGLVARRIVTWADTGDALTRGLRFGMIKFGSRVDVYLPHDYEPCVAEGERTVAGQTALARPKRGKGV
ncbi:Phosphatidylserine decarboxylase proenzyme [Desulfovibrio sp. X2]|uniref:phosphatidylserine decarboxylase family protein n=1 Tax=Desulfovibrio sp. X2 TaxID=941449 RepID=UPI000358E731|nr:phosphatidylserine decarboxylase family protein [Desulfovibrio sp. X2]EPR42664.1 Phosphatidylserine decarboxylase proenzyme [Desulfovibrio sp. X2]